MRRGQKYLPYWELRVLALGSRVQCKAETHSFCNYVYLRSVNIKKICPNLEKKVEIGILATKLQNRKGTQTKKEKKRKEKT